MQFRDVIGQSAIKIKLAGMAGSGRLPHAIMLLGPEGNGNLPLALALTQYIHCENKQLTDSCGECGACIKNQKNIHPDLHFTFPVVSKKSGEPPVSNDYIQEWRQAVSSNPYMSANEWLQNIGAENRQGNITVRECHEIVRGISMKTYESSYKIQIIWLAEFLKEAGNTLLKVIEEPPPNTVFILVVENIDFVLNTIISRSQIIKVPGIDDSDLQTALLQKFDIDENSALRMARISNGNFNAAMNYAEGEESANDKMLHRWLVCCFNLKRKNSSSNVSYLMEWIEEVSKIGRENQKIFLKYALFFLRECSLICLTGKSEKLQDDELKFATGLASKLAVDQLEMLAKVFTDMHYHIERNANPKILTLCNSFKIASIFKNEKVLETWI